MAQQTSSNTRAGDHTIPTDFVDNAEISRKIVRGFGAHDFPGELQSLIVRYLGVHIRLLRLLVGGTYYVITTNPLSLSLKGEEDFEEHERAIERMRMRRFLKKLSDVRGKDNSLMSLIVSGVFRVQLSTIKNVLETKFERAKTLCGRSADSMLSALMSTRETLKHYKKVPRHGLVVFCGTVKGDDGKLRPMNMHFEPFAPIESPSSSCALFHYQHGDRFCVEPIQKLTMDYGNRISFGLIEINGDGCHYGTLNPNTNRYCPIHRYTNTKRTTRSNRRHVRKCAKLANEHFIADGEPTVKRLVLSGFDNLQQDLHECDILDDRLKALVLMIGDTTNLGVGEKWLQHIKYRCASVLRTAQFARQDQLMTDFMQHKNSKKFCFGVESTIRALEMGVIETLLVFDGLQMLRLTLENTNERNVVFLSKERYEQGVALSVTKKEDLIEWLIDNHKRFGAMLEMVTNHTEMGQQLQEGFEGIGGILRRPIDSRDSDSEAGF